MSKSLLSFIFLAAFTSALAVAQTANSQTGATTTGDDGYATFGNRRPLIQKKDKPVTTRQLTGKVVDDTGQIIEGALVTLTDGKTHLKTTVITKKDGRYNFNDLSFSIDYEVQARYKEMLSPVRKLSQYDHMANVVRILEIASPPEPTAEAKK